MTGWEENGAIFIDTESRFSPMRLCEMAQAMFPANYSSDSQLEALAKRCTVFRCVAVDLKETCKARQLTAWQSSKIFYQPVFPLI